LNTSTNVVYIQTFCDCRTWVNYVDLWLPWQKEPQESVVWWVAFLSPLK